MKARRSLKFAQISLPTAELGALKRRKKSPYKYIYLQWGKQCCHFFSAVFDWISFKLTSNNDMHKSLDEFEILPDLIRDYRVSCP